MPTLYFPALHLPSPVGAQGAETPDYGALAHELAAAIIARRKTPLAWDDNLARVARLRCGDMFARAYFAHVNPDGIGPNRFLRDNGVRLPAGYDGGKTANNTESLRLGPLDVQDCLAALLGSAGHRAHIMGLGWYSGQVRIGVACGPSWDFLQSIWCVLTLHK